MTAQKSPGWHEDCSLAIWAQATWAQAIVAQVCTASSYVALARRLSASALFRLSACAVVASMSRQFALISMCLLYARMDQQATGATENVAIEPGATVVIHVGPHKTASKSVQSDLNDHASLLELDG